MSLLTQTGGNFRCTVIYSVVESRKFRNATISRSRENDGESCYFGQFSGDSRSENVTSGITHGGEEVTSSEWTRLLKSELWFLYSTSKHQQSMIPIAQVFQGVWKEIFKTMQQVLEQIHAHTVSYDPFPVTIRIVCSGHHRSYKPRPMTS